MDFDGASALITGISGIGRATAQLSANAGATVGCRENERVQQVAAATCWPSSRRPARCSGQPAAVANDPDEVADVIAYLAGNMARPLTGVVLAVDAGRTAAL